MFGIHIDNDNDVLDKINKYKKYGCNIFQIFVNTQKDLNYLNINENNFVVHISYSINLAQNWNNTSWWIQQFILEIEKAHTINAKFIVVHTGKQLNLTLKESINNMLSSLLYVHDKTKDKYNIKILIETSSGQGSEMLYDLIEFNDFFKKLPDRFGICLDTCHIFTAGYNITSKFLENFDKIINIKNIKLVHLNDSKNKLNSRLDRHENYGYGYINKKNIIKIAKYFLELNVPIIIETPDKYLLKDIDLLNKLSEKIFIE